jgi:hypothetical protein
MTRDITIHWTSEEALLVRALMRDPAHEKAVMLILVKACGVGENSFIPGEDGRRETDFNLGRLAVAQSLVPLRSQEASKIIAQRQNPTSRAKGQRRKTTEAKENG